MYDTSHEHGILIAFDTLMFVISILFFVSMMISIFFRGPLERLIFMFFELQIILHFPILEVSFPGNVITAFNIFLPLSKFDFLGFMMSGSFVDSVEDAEDKLSYLGQRMTIGYDSYNLYRNLSSFYLFLIFYLAKMAILFIIFKPLSIRYKQFKKLYKKLLP